MANFQFKDSYWDIKTAFSDYYLWTTLGWYDVLARYRRSTLGPLWITLSMLLTIVALGPLYGSLFGLQLSQFIPHLALGMMVWLFIAMSLNEFCVSYIESQHYLKQVKIPLSVFVLRVLYRQCIIFCHNMIIFIFIIVIFGTETNWNTLWFFPAFFILLLNLFALGMILSIFCTRYRDMTPVVVSVMQLMFFVTPVIWTSEQLPKNMQFLLVLNPLGTLLNLVRQPLLGILPSSDAWIMSIIFGAMACLIAFVLLSRTVHRVTYWL